MKDNPKYKILHSALILFECHMEEVKRRMEAEVIQKTEEQQTAKKLVVLNID